jgi:hypothetical protein
VAVLENMGRRPREVLSMEVSQMNCGCRRDDEPILGGQQRAYDSGYKSGYQDGYYEGQESALMWTSVKDRLPESETLIVGYSTETELAYLGYYIDGFFEDNHGRRDTTHWLLLPKQPAEIEQ